MKPYEMLLHRQVHDFILGNRPAIRTQAYKLLAALAADPFIRGDLQIKDTTGRPLEVLRVSRLEVIYWVDHPVKEIKVLSLRSLK
jgi:hypothetical protein